VYLFAPILELPNFLSYGIPDMPNKCHLLTKLIEALRVSFLALQRNESCFGGGLLLAMPVYIVFHLFKDTSWHEAGDRCVMDIREMWAQIPGSEGLLLPDQV